MDEEREFKIRQVLNDFCLLTKSEQKKLSIEELSSYLTKERLYKYVNNIPVVDYDKAKTYPVSKFVLAANRVLLDHQKIRIIGDRRTDSSNSKLYCITHIGKYDYQIVAEAINDHAIPFAGDPETLYRTIDGAFLERNQVVYCNVYDKLDCYVGEKSMINLLRNHNNGLIYPEGFWNLSPNLLVMPLFPGAIRMAILGHADLVPVAIEKYDNNFFVNIGKNIEVNSYSIDDKNYIEYMKQVLRDTLAELKYEILIEVPEVYRASLDSFSMMEENFQSKIFNEYLDKNKRPIFSMKTVEERRFKPKDPNTGVIIEKPDDVFSYLKKVKINANNVFMFRDDASLSDDLRLLIHGKLSDSLSENQGAIRSVNEIKKLILK